MRGRGGGVQKNLCVAVDLSGPHVDVAETIQYCKNNQPSIKINKFTF